MHELLGMWRVHINYIYTMLAAAADCLYNMPVVSIALCPWVWNCEHPLCSDRALIGSWYRLDIFSIYLAVVLCKLVALDIKLTNFWLKLVLGLDNFCKLNEVVVIAKFWMSGCYDRCCKGTVSNKLGCDTKTVQADHITWNCLETYWRKEDSRFCALSSIVCFQLFICILSCTVHSF